ncbi:phosphate ABC transporter substrate-binding/OmpA family protein [Cytophagaceae bacterium DM2B3-1]|uniref:Phosphate ABC transporter substrate-binding/OmpA family protein n=1 Tax=Xanthocytophaga flava TaxID=3048013 RepID=A0ABT7CRP9_9BACT|nr:phosphate ABC transporter substrate-binding/OmpA family protein [Xanthocytophaga flavus]MDJ1468646.1 phosphate ABC transporter substrate-binding/OmpA family protein [Xanthocytophaga flavus]MDJ1496426.1 phosphate ABC transporter substrate-binding/OmpA family protein [Xanthocytophaga flavus]
MKRLTPLGRITIVALILAGLWGLKWLIMDSGYVMTKQLTTSQDVGKVDLPTAPKNASSTVQAMSLPGEKPANLNSPQVRWLMWAWNAQMGAILANGGSETTEGSIMAKKGVNLKITRQDDVPQMQASLIKFANEYKSNPSTPEGAHFVTIMGDGAAAFLSGVNPELEKIGPDYRAQIIYTCGKSLGEDKFMGLPSWRDNPQSAKGGLTAAVLRDGDWNIVVKWCGDNGIRINPDETTYDPDAMNFVAADNYLDAAEKYIAGYSEDREVVQNGKRTGEKKRVSVNGVATWTPGDVNIAEKKGGLVSIVSTKEYRSQMPCVLIGIKKYMEDNRPTVEKMIEGIAEGGDQVKSYSAALDKAGELSAKVYNEADKAYWVKYYKGTQSADKQGLVVDLGGSAVHNLGDNAEIFGLNSGSTNVVKIVYDLFGGVASKLYPKLMPSYPKSDDVIEVSYLKDVIAKAGSNVSAAETVAFTNDANIKEKVSEKSWSIEFESGKASFTPQTEKTLNELFNDLVVANNLRVEIHGHTDNTGDPSKNMNLSEERAFAVKQWMEQKSPNNFPQGRVQVFAHGQTQPIVPNNSPENKAKNRRVTIVMGK